MIIGGLNQVKYKMPAPACVLGSRVELFLNFMAPAALCDIIWTFSMADANRGNHVKARPAAAVVQSP